MAMYILIEHLNLKLDVARTAQGKRLLSIFVHFREAENRSRIKFTLASAWQDVNL